MKRMEKWKRGKPVLAPDGLQLVGSVLFHGEILVAQ